MLTNLELLVLKTKRKILNYKVYKLTNKQFKMLSEQFKLINERMSFDIIPTEDNIESEKIKIESLKSNIDILVKEVLDKRIEQLENYNKKYYNKENN